MKKTFISTGLGALMALAFVPVLATAAPPDAFHAELIYLDAPPGHTVTPAIADDVSFDAIGDEGSERDYQIERMPGMVETPALSLTALSLTGSEVGVLFDPLVKPAIYGAMVKA